MSKKIKVFLGGFINYTNAQNLNCLALAKYLDKEKFTVYTLVLFSGNLESQQDKIKGVHIFNCFKPYRISGYLGFLWGIWHCDVAYLPKGEHWKFNRFILKFLGKKSFSTVEGIFDEENLKSAIQAFGSYDEFLDSNKFFNKLYPITDYLRSYNEKHHNMMMDSKVLYLGCDTETFRNTSSKSYQLKKIVYIGRLKRRKGIYDFLEIAGNFPDLDFEIFGNGEEEENIKNFLKEEQLNNVTLKGTVTHQELAKHLKTSDLHIFPSRSEGFPKVTLETAAAGIPSIVYGDYGANEWITSGKNGWVVNTVDETKELIAQLKNSPTELERISKNAIELAASFDWKIIVKDWEQEIEKLYKCL